MVSKRNADMPTTPLRNFSRFVAICRANYVQRIQDQDFRKALESVRISYNDKLQYAVLTRGEVQQIAQYLFDVEDESGNRPFTSADLSNLEHGRSALNRDKCYWIMRGLGFDTGEANRILNIFLVRASLALNQNNPSLFLRKEKELLIGMYGELASQRTYAVGNELLAPWISCAIADKGGFASNEIAFRVDSGRAFDIPDEINEYAQEKKNEWDEARAANLKAPFNGPTLALCDYSVDSTADEYSGERNVIRLNLAKSEYALNVAAKNSSIAEIEKHKNLTTLTPSDDFQPVPWLASGVGIAINVFSDGGKKIILGHRSNLETFRSSEYDVAVVEGIRPDFNVKGVPDNDKTDEQKVSFIDIHEAMWRGLDEELGLGRDKDSASNIKIFEFGCDLKYYQWNFLATVTFDLTSEEIIQRWERSKSRRENNFLTAIEADRDKITSFVSEVPMWSCGVACLLEAIRLRDLDAGGN